MTDSQLGLVDCSRLAACQLPSLRFASLPPSLLAATMSTSASSPARSPRLTIIPLVAGSALSSHCCSSLCPFGYGLLLPFPSSYAALVALVAAAVSLPGPLQPSISLFVDEGPEQQHGPPAAAPAARRRAPLRSAEAAATEAWSAAGPDDSGALSAAAAVDGMGRQGGEVTQRTFCLLRDNDVLHAVLVPPSEQPRPRKRVELRVLDAASGASVRFEINPRKRLQQLIHKYEQRRGWSTGSWSLACRRKRQRRAQQHAGLSSHAPTHYDGEHDEDEDEDEEVQLSGTETCESAHLGDGSLLYAYKR